MRLKILDINNVEYLYADDKVNDYLDFSNIVNCYKFIRVIRIYDKKEMLIVNDKIKCVYEVK
ncbi:MAG: hypothetical protein SOY04_00125 [Clostridium celatum]|nr:hypothetical protein [Clostridium celatum]